MNHRTNAFNNHKKFQKFITPHFAHFPLDEVPKSSLIKNQRSQAFFLFVPWNKRIMKKTKKKWDKQELKKTEHKNTTQFTKCNEQHCYKIVWNHQRNEVKTQNNKNQNQRKRKRERKWWMSLALPRKWWNCWDDTENITRRRRTTTRELHRPPPRPPPQQRRLKKTRESDPRNPNPTLFIWVSLDSLSVNCESEFWSFPSFLLPLFCAVLLNVGMLFVFLLLLFLISCLSVTCLASVCFEIVIPKYAKWKWLCFVLKELEEEKKEEGE